jgi:DNA-binding response OmpR family regulator
VTDEPTEMAPDAGDRRARVLVVDHSEATRDLVRIALAREHIEVHESAGGEAAVADVIAEHPDLVLLDVSMPGLDGLQVLARIRELSPIPVILFSAKSGEQDRVRGLDMGADDLIVKPFSPAELAARIRSVLRRAGRAATAATIEFPGLRIEAQARQVYVGDAEISLPRREFDLLVTLATAPGRAFTRGELLRVVWGSQEEWQTASTVTEHVRRLRNKIEDDPNSPRWIRTVQRIGYRFEPPRQP